jgi:peroxiredoxin
MRVCIAGGILLCVASISVAAPSDDPSCLIGAPAPKIELPDVNGNPFRLSDHSGDEQALLIVFWGVWCPYCREIMVRLSRDYPSLKERGLEVIAISMRESAAKVALFIDKLAPAFPVLIDEWGSLKDHYLIRDVPLAVILDPDHVVQAAVITTSAEKVTTMIDKALAPTPNNHAGP